MKHQEDARILANARLKGEYYRVELCAPRIAPCVEPGQFVHVQFPALAHRLLRRPFSVCDVSAEDCTLSIVYKTVGEGTQHLSRLAPGQRLNVIGPLGVGYSATPTEATPVIVAGGYGCAATFLLAKQVTRDAICLFGGRTRDDLLLLEEFAALGCRVRTATDDGSAGHHGRVTDLLADELRGQAKELCVYACGPNPMLAAVWRIVHGHGLDAQVSLDHVMCCGVGACFTCVLKMRGDTPEQWRYARTCVEGPVFRASDVYWEDGGP